LLALNEGFLCLKGQEFYLTRLGTVKNQISVKRPGKLYKFQCTRKVINCRIATHTSHKTFTNAYKYILFDLTSPFLCNFCMVIQIKEYYNENYCLTDEISLLFYRKMHDSMFNCIIYIYRKSNWIYTFS